MSVGTILDNTYLIEAEIGKGGMGIIYRARHKLMPKLFAIKSLLPELAPNEELRERFLAELNTHCQMSHPNIVQVTHCFNEKESLYVVMEYIAGTSLDKQIKSLGHLSEKEALTLLRPIVEAIGHAHQKNIIHRDIKPSNILIDEDKRPKVTDFGIAIVSNVRRITKATGVPIGTPHYMSPEQIKSPLTIDHRSDIYSLGILLYEMLTGDAPYDGETEFAVQDQIVNSPTPNPRAQYTDISDAVVKIIHKAMEKDPAKRFQSCAEFIKAIDRLINPHLSPWKITAISLSLAIFLGFGIYILFPEKVREVITEVKVIDPKQQHETAFAMLQAASEQALIFCAKRKELPLKQNNLTIAEQNGYFDLVGSYKSQVHDIEMTMQASFTKYADFVGKLRYIPADIVDFEFDKYKNSLLETDRAEQIRNAEFVLKAVKAEYTDIELACQ